ncbi:DNA-processing protein DprA [Variovorax dokdonensis]|uniref:DNA-processing protein DprA n=1 Tax=Variovorax dokdonensis TaxID=344883 RepID=A0ABT7N9Q8_9BURK|nr:DNA-processing protein DprA [Variovorax dokdonensis]MDM0044684.1 DNA-processing protein DprA [Variovorax dokdonensis]
MGPTRDELSDWLRLALTPGVGPGTARRLLAAFGLPGAIFSQSRAALLQVASAEQASALAQPPEPLAALLECTWSWLQDDPGVRRVVTLDDAHYPPSLLQIADPPMLLHVMGPPQLSLLQLERSIAVVGSRNPTAQGADHAKAFARALGDAGWAVVSGLALGVDGAAHEGALASASTSVDQIATVAVVGTGLDRVYPARHRDLAHRIAQRGLLVSEFVLGTPPLTPNFPKRNRLIAGLTRGTLVVEAALQSGSLITARMAVEQGKEVFAIPGSIHSPQSRGCHALIRQGAKLVESVQDILEELGTQVEVSNSSAHETTPKASEDDPLLVALGHEPTGLDALVARTGWPAPQLQARLLELELDGVVARLPGGLFQRTGHA